MGEAENKGTAPDEKGGGDSLKELVALAGYGSPATIVYWPKRHDAILKAVKALIPFAPPDLQSNLKESFEKLPIHGALPMISIMASAINIEISEADLSELDLNKPIVVGLTRNLGSWLLLAKDLVKDGQTPPAALHTRVVLPARDSAALVASLRKVFVQSGFEAPKGEDNTFNTTELSLRLETQGKVVLLDILQGAGAAKISSESISDTSVASQADSWLWNNNDASLLVHFRFTKFEDSASYAGALMVASALKVVDAKLSKQLASQGISEILSLSALTSPRLRLAEAGQLRISKSGEASQLVYQLSQVGTDHFAKYLDEKKPETFSSLMKGPLVEAAPAYFPEIQEVALSHIVELIHESGIAATLYMIGPNALPMMRLATKENPALLDKVMTDTLSSNAKAVPARRKGSVLALDLLGSLALPEGKPAPLATKEELCLYSAKATTRKVLKAVAQGDPAHHKEVVNKGRLEVEPHLACAEKDKALSSQIDLLRSLF